MSQAGIYINSTGPSPILETLTGNSGGAVGPTGNNINVVGSGNITVVGNPGTSTLTISEVSSSATTFDADMGSATASAGIVNLLGGTGITTSASGNTVTFSATGITTLTYVAVTHATGSPYVVLTTDDYISCDSSAGTITINLPNAPAVGRVFIVKDRTGSATANNVTVTTVGGVETIDGATTFVMNTNYESAQFIFNGTGYEVF